MYVRTVETARNASLKTDTARFSTIELSQIETERVWMLKVGPTPPNPARIPLRALAHRVRKERRKETEDGSRPAASIIYTTIDQRRESKSHAWHF